MRDNSLRVENLHVSYEKLEVLHDVTFKVTKNDFVGLIGANGAGKSTVLKTIVGQLTPLKGNVVLEGKNINKMSIRERLLSGITYVPQGRRVFGSLTVRENLELLSDDYAHVLDFFPNIKDKLSIMAGSLSGGEQQMLSISRALLLKPKFILLDEPSLGLSPLFVDKIFKRLIEVNKNGVGILVVEQNVKKVLEYAHFAYLLELGKIKRTVTEKDLKNPEFKKAYLGV